MRIIFCLATSFWMTNVTANTQCDLVDKASLLLAVHASNWSNAISTRTPDGGPYKYKILYCEKTCKIIEELKTFIRYEPDHPDANENGYVTYPDIDKTNEFIAMTANAQVLRQLGKACPEKMKVTDDTRLAIIEYKKGPIKLDIFNFNLKNNLTSWVRQDLTGEQILNF